MFLFLLMAVVSAAGLAAYRTGRIVPTSARADAYDAFGGPLPPTTPRPIEAAQCTVRDYLVYAPSLSGATIAITNDYAQLPETIRASISSPAAARCRSTSSTRVDTAVPRRVAQRPAPKRGRPLTFRRGANNARCSPKTTMQPPPTIVSLTEREAAALRALCKRFLRQSARGSRETTAMVTNVASALKAIDEGDARQQA